MKRELMRTILDCLRVDGPSGANVARLRSFSRRAWASTLPWLRQSGLALYFLRRLQDQGGVGEIPRYVAKLLARNYQANCRRVAAMREEFSALNQSFEGAVVPYAVLKGFSMTPDYCLDATLRTQYDFDYLITPLYLRRAEEALRQMSFIPSGRSCGARSVFFFAALPPRIPSSDDDLYSPGLPRRIELHSSLWEKGAERWGPVDEDVVLGRVRVREWCGVRFTALNDEDALVFQVLHAIRHIFVNWCRLATLLEIASFLHRRASDEAFWERFCSAADIIPGFSPAAAVVFALATQRFGPAIPDALREWTRTHLTPAMNLWVETYGVHSALKNFTGDKYSLFLHREFIAEEKAWRDVRRRRLFPLHAPPRVVRAASRSLHSRIAAEWKQSLHAFRRLVFHTGSGLRYAFELPGWGRRLANATRGAASRDDSIERGVAAPSLNRRVKEPAATRDWPVK